jgi:hypothetical protein
LQDSLERLLIAQQRPDNRIHVVGHPHKTDEFNIRFITGGVDGSAQSATPIIVCESCQPAITGKGQLAKMTRLVKMTNLLPVLLRFGHVA